MRDFTGSLSIEFAPLIAEHILFILCGVIAALTIYGYWKRRKGTSFRLFGAIFFVLVLSNPSLLEQDRKALKDVALVLLDTSPSQNMQDRMKRSREALKNIEQQFKNNNEIELRIVETSADNLATETLLFSHLERSFSDIPAKRRAGVIIISDGQIHDIPHADTLQDRFGPVHILLSGEKNEIDRQIKIIHAPAYGIVGQNVAITFTITDTNIDTKNSVPITVTRNNQDTETIFARPGQELTLDFNIENAGQNVFEFSVDALNNEITTANNKAAVLVNGVRDRLRVLLVSGKPHAGGRTWRDLLTSDPSVDLIHFTILREPTKLDSTPQRELSLIAFPFRELFEIKLYDFDLIIFDRYKLNRILPQHYFKNIEKYVEEGGALLVSSGPSYAGDDSVYYTSLMNILPAAPNGEVINKSFYPKLSRLGKQHPVTRSLIWNSGAAKPDSPNGWGQWLRQIPLRKDRGVSLMEGDDNQPLLILDRVKKGRVALIGSDHIWLWSRGYQGGGPHSELLRRIVHWLMKEPQLDERALTLSLDGNDILVKTIDLDDKNETIKMIRPDGTQETVSMDMREDAIRQARITANQLGIYSFTDGYGETKFLSVGDLNPPELRSVITTPDHIAPVLDKTGGGALWLEEDTSPTIRVTSKNRERYAGANWIALRHNNAFSIDGFKSKSLLPYWLALVVLLVSITALWWYEGRRS